MGNLSREGHRDRVRESYLLGDMKNAPDHNLLELFLMGIIPRKDVKPLAYDIINHFGSLERVINASPQDLMEVKGVGKSTAIQISLIKTIYKRVIQNKNNDVKSLPSLESATEYCKNLLSEEMVEKAYLITMDGNYRIIGTYCVSSGGLDETSVNIRTIISNVIRDQARFIYFTHNHPMANSFASAADVNFTRELNKTMRDLRIVLLEHIIIGKNDVEYIMKNYFKSTY